MKRNSILRKVFGFMIGMLLLGNAYIIPATAGSSDIVIDNSSFMEELDGSLWNNRNEDVQVQNSAIVFPKESISQTGLISKKNMKISGKHNDLVTSEVTMKLTQIPENQKFVLGLGLSSVEAEVGEPGNIEIAFFRQGKVKTSVTVYDEEGKAMELVAATTCGTIGQTLKVKANITTNKLLSVSINGKQICKKEIPVSGEGRFGFLQTGSCAATVTNLKIVSHTYETPQNCDVYEDFENETINVNALTSKIIEPCTSYFPTGAFVDKIDGNGVFRFQNAGSTYLGSRYPYSNFELTFDVLNLQRQEVLDEEGNVLTMKNANICVSFGGETADFTGYGYDNATDLVIFSGDGGKSAITSWHTGNAVLVDDTGYPFYAEDCNKDFSIKVSMIDSVVTVGLKWINEAKFKEVMRYQVSTETPTGYVHLWTTGRASNFAIDNLRIVNKDEGANLITVDHANSELLEVKDFDYQPLEYIYEDKPEEKEESFNIYLVIPAVTLLCLITFCVAGSICVKKKNRKEGNRNGTKQNL